jgi:hypothetical protein
VDFYFVNNRYKCVIKKFHSVINKLLVGDITALFLVAARNRVMKIPIFIVIYMGLLDN